MFRKYLIIASKKDTAGVNITTQLSQFRQNPLLSTISDKPSFDFYLIDTEIVDDSGIDIEKIQKYDFIIFASKHQSESKQKTLSIHAPGNWLQTPPQLGGQPGKISPTSALFLKQTFEKLDENRKKYNLDYKLTLEATHHGPLINKPCIFIEIGSTENEWKDRRAGFAIAKTISEIIEEFKENPYREIAIAIGGPHYCPNFNKIQLNSNIAISHIIPSYVLPLKEEMLDEAVKKTLEEIDLAVIDWKGLGGAEQRKQVLEVLDRFYIRYEKTSEVRK
jgi:D-aminoacyl-tRNA deacylase